MALPATRALVDFLRDDGRGEEPDINPYIEEVADPETRKRMVMAMKRRYQERMMQNMLKNAGYSDLASKVRIKSEDYEVPEEGY